MNIHRRGRCTLYPTSPQLEQIIDKIYLIDKEITFEKHICEKVNKANATFAQIRTFKSMSADMFISLYKTLEHTHLDYASSVWAHIKRNTLTKCAKSSHLANIWCHMIF